MTRLPTAGIMSGSFDMDHDQTDRSDIFLREGPAALMFAQASEDPDRLAIRFDDDLWSRGRLADSVEALARGLASRGLQPGDRVVLHLPNRPEMIVALLACYRTGVIACPMRIQWTQAELSPLIGRMRPALYIGCEETFRNVADVDRTSLPDDRRVVIDGPGTGQRWADLLASGQSAGLPSRIDMEAPALLISTSGTTGQPKLSVHSLRTLCRGAGLFFGTALNHNDHSLLSVSLGHASGAFVYIGVMAAGGSCELMDRPEPAEVLDKVEQSRITSLIAMPNVFADLVSEQRDRPRNVKSVKFCLTAGDVTPIEVQQAVRDHFGVRLQSTWATTEAVGSFAPGLRDGPLCRPNAGTEVTLTDQQGSKVAEGQPGELRLRGPNLFLGYWEAPGQIDDALDSGWFRTGDIMQEEKDGQYRFVSRIKDLIIRAGTNISPMEVEQVLLSHPLVKEAAVFGAPDQRLGQRVQALIVLKPDAKAPASQEILRYTAERLADYKVPEALKVVSNIPRNALGKVDRTLALAETS